MQCTFQSPINNLNLSGIKIPFMVVRSKVILIIESLGRLYLVLVLFLFFPLRLISQLSVIDYSCLEHPFVMVFTSYNFTLTEFHIILNHIYQSFFFLRLFTYIFFYIHSNFFYRGYINKCYTFFCKKNIIFSFLSKTIYYWFDRFYSENYLKSYL